MGSIWDVRIYVKSAMELVSKVLHRGLSPWNLGEEADRIRIRHSMIDESSTDGFIKA